MLRTRSEDNTSNARSESTTPASKPETAHEYGPIGAPKASQVREVLTNLKSRLEAQLQDSDDHDPLTLRALRENIRGQLEQINEALMRIDLGKYGVCANCLKPIEADRLVVRPYSTLCVECQNRRDRRKLARY